MTRILFGKWVNLTQPIRRQLSKKLKMFAQFCTTFLQSAFTFEHCEKKDEPHSSCISEVIDSEKRGYLNV